MGTSYNKGSLKSHKHSTASGDGGGVLTPGEDVILANGKKYKMSSGIGNIALGSQAGNDLLEIKNIAGNIAGFYTGQSQLFGNLITNSLVDGVDVSKLSLGKKYVIGEAVLHSHDAPAQRSGTSYVVMKVITINKLLPTPSILRIKFDLAGQAPTMQAYCKIYKNGNPFGTERNNPTGGSDYTYDTFTEDLSFVEGDTIEVWVKSGAIAPSTVKNFRVHGSEADLDD